MSKEATKEKAATNPQDCDAAEHPIKDITTRSFRECYVLDGITKKDLAAITNKFLAELACKK